jgi:hypothetical protein
MVVFGSAIYSQTGIPSPSWLFWRIPVVYPDLAIDSGIRFSVKIAMAIPFEGDHLYIQLHS